MRRFTTSRAPTCCTHEVTDSSCWNDSYPRSRLPNDPTWHTDVEAGRRYRQAAQRLAASQGERPGYRFVVFGHTHHAKRVPLDGMAEGAAYLNSGTWANLLELPRLPPDDIGALATILKFAEDVRDNNFDAKDRQLGDADGGPCERLQQVFHPTYVRLDVDRDRVEDGALGVYDWQNDRFE